MYLTYVSFYSTIFTFLCSSYMKETEWISCCPQNLTKSLFNIVYTGADCALFYLLLPRIIFVIALLASVHTCDRINEFDVTVIVGHKQYGVPFTHRYMDIS